MKRYTINLGNKSNNIFSGSNFSNPSKDLDNLILSNVIKMNPYLGNTSRFTSTSPDPTLKAMLAELRHTDDDHIIIPNRNYRTYLKGNFDTEFAKAADFLANFTPKKSTYKLYDDTIIKFFEDEIQIGYDLIPLYELRRPAYYNNLSENTKNIIINLYITINA